MTAARQLADRVARTHELIRKVADACTDDELTWHPGPTAPPITFHLWHLARWADRWAEALGAPSQVWTRRGLASAWAFPAELGGGETGMHLPDEEAVDLPFPGRDELSAYLAESFAHLEEALGRLTDADLLREEDDLLGVRAPLGESLLRQLSHASRHLGMIEALRGVRGSHGTATA